MLISRIKCSKRMILEKKLKMKDFGKQTKDESLFHLLIICDESEKAQRPINVILSRAANGKIIYL